MSQGSEWQEMSSPDATGNERRMLMVCQIKKPNQNNWLRTQYIPVQGAKRVYVEVEFTIRSCEDVPNVATCKETFNLYYYQTDRDEATTTFPPWREGAYIKVDTIAADQRFQPGSADTNFETRDIGPITKNGIYLAIQDTGACVALMHVRVYYKYCEEATENLATFTRTTAGPEMTSLVETKGSCVRNAITENRMMPSLYCNGEGAWTVPSGSCVCTAGYEPDRSLTQCKACKNGFYKSAKGNKDCKMCPAYSLSRNEGATVCDCMYGYFRSPTDRADHPCTKPPSKPISLYSKVNNTSVILSWNPPLNDGGRSDMTYRLDCLRCLPGFENCASCPDKVQYEPSKQDFVATKVAIKNLSSYAYYKFRVCAANAVTSVAISSGHLQNNCAEVTVETNQAAPSAVLDVKIDDVTENSVIVSWDEPDTPNGPIQEYEITVDSSSSSLDDKDSFPKRFRVTGADKTFTVTDLTNSSPYTIKVRARTAARFGPYSKVVHAETRERAKSSPGTQSHLDDVPAQSGIEVTHLAIAIGGGVLLVIIVVVVIVVCKKRNRQLEKKKLDAEKQPMFNGNSSGQFNRTFASAHKTYIDPTTYEDPHRAVREFTKEIDASYVKIEQVIGGGEFGEVCRGRLQLPNKTEHDIAIKTLKSGYSTQQKLDFLGEASIMGQFDHPNVIRLEGVVTKSRPLMIITEYMENGSLDSFLRKHDNQFSVIQMVGILRNIAAGMKYLSDMGYVHRDLAARNILVNAQLICKVSDFGMSRVLEEDSDAAYTTRGGKIPIRWTAPEAFTFRKFTSASDVWSYGIVMWEVMSYGERPYWGMSNRDVMNAVETGYRLPAPMDCPQVQHRLMLESWKKDRNQRPKFGQIVTSLDKMLRDPAQLKVKAGSERPRVLPDGTARPASSLGSALPTSSQLPASKAISIPAAPIDSGISEDMDEEAPMLGGDGDIEMKAVSQSPHVDMSSMGVWLESLGLSQYKDNFTRNGCTSLEQIVQLNSSDLTRMGIMEEPDQERLLKSIQEDATVHYSRQPGLPTYTESNMMHAGISV
ncbi:unnamed protein product [Clavelina lepadiformis]|uniref:receptor protein-tyrosine kinase n=1 Tax=Clavelina lepadiformis TaxID=159417 RepID=A0ABP0H348_CLALP